MPTPAPPPPHPPARRRRGAAQRLHRRADGRLLQPRLDRRQLVDDGVGLLAAERVDEEATIALQLAVVRARVLSAERAALQW